MTWEWPVVWQLGREDPNSRLELLTAEPQQNLVDYEKRMVEEVTGIHQTQPWRKAWDI